MGKRLEQLEAIIASRDVHFTVSDDGEDLRLPCKGKNGEWTCVISVPDEVETIRAYSIIPFKVPPHKRMAVAAFITMVNWDLVGSRLEMNWKTGTLCCESDRFLGGAEIEEDVIVWMIDCTHCATDFLIPGLIRVIGSDVTPAKAFADLEAGRAARAISSLN